MEREIKLRISGWFVVLLQLGILGYILNHFVTFDWNDPNSEKGFWFWGYPVIAFIGGLILFASYVVVAPNEAAIFGFMGKYKGTLRTNGFYCINPLWGAKPLSLRVQNLQTPIIKVNDLSGVPLEVGAAATYRIRDTYKAAYASENMENFLQTQFDMCLRDLVKKHTYNQLVSNDTEFKNELEQAFEQIGVEVTTAKLITLNYATEISEVMLQKQIAQAMSDAKKIIVQNATSMADDAAKQIVFPSSQEKARFTANLILILCSERGVTPTINVNE